MGAHGWGDAAGTAGHVGSRCITVSAPQCHHLTLCHPLSDTQHPITSHRVTVPHNVTVSQNITHSVTVTTPQGSHCVTYCHPCHSHRVTPWHITASLTVSPHVSVTVSHCHAVSHNIKGTTPPVSHSTALAPQYHTVTLYQIPNVTPCHTASRDVTVSHCHPVSHHVTPCHDVTAPHSTAVPPMAVRCHSVMLQCHPPAGQRHHLHSVPQLSLVGHIHGDNKHELGGTGCGAQPHSTPWGPMESHGAPQGPQHPTETHKALWSPIKHTVPHRAHAVS